MQKTTISVHTRTREKLETLRELGILAGFNSKDADDMAHWRMATCEQIILFALKAGIATFSPRVVSESAPIKKQPEPEDRPGIIENDWTPDTK